MKNLRPWAIVIFAAILLIAGYLIWSADGPNPKPAPGPGGPPNPGGEVGDSGLPPGLGGPTGAASGQTMPPQPKEELVKVLEKTDKGFFFFHGFYVAPPYTVTLHTYAVRINGLKVAVRPWGKPERFRPMLTKEPPPFEWTAKRLKKGFNRSGFTDHASRRFRFWQREYGHEVACKRVLEYFREQPLITNVHEDSEGRDFCVAYRVLTEGKGSQRGVGFGSGAKVDHKEVWKRRTKRLTENADYFRDLLDGGFTLIYGRGYAVLDPFETKKRLPRLHAILIIREALPKEKLGWINAENLIPDPNMASDLAERYDYNDSPELRQRIEKLYGGIIKPAVFPKKEGVRNE